MQTNDTLQKAEEFILKTYIRQNIVLESGKGVYLYDKQNKKYLDFGAGIAVCALGYGRSDFNDAIKSQIDKIIHTSNLYYNEPAILAAAKICEASGMSKVFFTNSGTEANEGALKVVKKYAFARDKHHKHNVIAFNEGFHGRSLGSLSITENPKYQEAFKPLLEGVRFSKFNDFASVEKNIDSQTCAIILETVQGEGGITPATKDFLVKLRRVCDDNDILLVLDEIQCGMGRSGKMFAWQHFGIKPDIFTTAKGLGNGLPVGAFIINEKVAESSLVPGEHGSTYGGNPLVCSGVNAVFEILKKDNIIENAANMGKYLEEKLDYLVDKYDIFTKRQGMGLLQGLWVKAPEPSESNGGVENSKIISKALENNLIILGAGGNSLRFAPPLVISKEHIDSMISILEKIVSELI